MSSMTPKDYERLVKSLTSTIFDGLRAQAFHLKKYRGKSGQEYEVDVSFEVAVDTLEFLVLVECKRYKDRVGVDEITSFAYRLRDIGAHKGIVVSPGGFQKGAVQVAKAERIALLVARDEIEFKPKQLRTIIGLVRPVPYTAWFSRLALATGGEDHTDVIPAGRAFIPRTGDHEIVALGAGQEALNHPRLQHKLTDANAYLCPCFLLVENEADLNGIEYPIALAGT